jgi:hypothetical protein
MAKGSGGSGRGGGGGGGITAANWRADEYENAPPLRAARDQIQALGRSGANPEELNRLVVAVAQRMSDISSARSVLRDLERLPRLSYNVQNAVQSWGAGRPATVEAARSAALARYNQLRRARV